MPRHDGPLSKESEKYLNGLKEAELVALVREICRNSSDAADLVASRAKLARGTVRSIVSAARKELRRVTSIGRARKHGRGEEGLPDYSRLAEYLEHLCEAGHADTVVALGEELIERAKNQAQQSEDGGAETGWRASECLDHVWVALANSSLSPPEQIVWYIDKTIDDVWRVVNPADEEPAFLGAGHEAWSSVADELIQRQEHQRPPPEAKGPLLDGWGQYRDLVHWVVVALDRAGRGEEATRVSVDTAPHTLRYDEAVERLIEADRTDEAWKLAAEGIDGTRIAAAGVAYRLRERLKQWARDRGNGPLLAALTAVSLFERPSLDAYRELRESVEPLGLWRETRVAILGALESGALLPDAWPLPDPGLEWSRDGFARHAPWHAVLARVAIEEEDPERALRWHRAACAAKGLEVADHLSVEVAESIASTYPEEALAIWKALAAIAAAHTHGPDCAPAVDALRRVRKLLMRLGRPEEWEAHLAQVRKKNSRRRKFLTMLNELEQEPLDADA